MANNGAEVRVSSFNMSTLTTVPVKVQTPYIIPTCDALVLYFTTPLCIVSNITELSVQQNDPYPLQHRFHPKHHKHFKDPRGVGRNSQ